MRLVPLISMAALATLSVLVGGCAGSEFSGGSGQYENYDELHRLKKTFNIVSQEAASIALNDGRIYQDISLVKKFEPRTNVFTQVERPLMTLNKKQGSSAKPFHEIHHQTKDGGVLDLLIVIDDSGSMGDEQSHIKANLPSLISAVDQADWRIALVSTDSGKPCNRGIVNKADANRELKFKGFIEDIGTIGSGYERGIYTAQSGLNCQNPTSWIRPGSSLAILFISDEQNCGNENNCGGLSSSPEDLKSLIENTFSRTIGHDFRAYGLITRNDRDYKKVIDDSKGISRVIQDITALPALEQPAKYAEVLTEISEDLKDLLEPDFVLKAIPQPATLMVKVDGVDKVLNVDYVVSENILSFKRTSLPAPNAEIMVDYISVSSMTKEIALGAEPAASTLKVKVGGVPAVATSYTVADQKLTFAEYPPELADIEITFRNNAVKLQTIFPLDEKAVKLGMVLKLGDIPDPKFTFDEDLHQVEYLNPNSDNAEIKIDYKVDAGPKLEYPVVISGSAPDNFEVVNKNTKAAISASVSGNIMVIPSDSFVLGQVLTFSHSTDESLDMEFSTPFKVDPSTVKVSPVLANCDMASRVVAFDGLLKVACDREAGKVYTVSFLSEKRFAKEFDMSTVIHPEIGRWTVKLDGKEIKYKREDRKIIILDAIPENAKEVEISYDPFN